MSRHLSSYSGFVYLLTAIVLWSTAEVVVRTIVMAITPIQLTFIRFAVGGLFLSLFLPGELRRRRVGLTWRIVLHGAWIALIGIVMSTLAFHYSLRYAGAAVVATVYGTTPLMVFVLARLILNEPMTYPKFIGVLLGFLGILVLALSEESVAFSLLGLGLALLCNVCFALFTVVSKRFAGVYAGLPIVVICMLWGIVMMAPLAWAEGDVQTLAHWRTLLLPLLYISLGTTGIAYLCYFIGLARVEATQAASMIFLKPPIATILAATLLGEPVTWNLILCMALTFTGLYLVIVLNRRVMVEHGGYQEL
jgi:drug/metabolite transporter (DMT)-like permease